MAYLLSRSPLPPVLSHFAMPVAAVLCGGRADDCFALQVIGLSGWAVFPLFVDIVLLWAVFGQHITVDSLRG